MQSGGLSQNPNMSSTSYLILIWYLFDEIFHYLILIYCMVINSYLATRRYVSV